MFYNFLLLLQSISEANTVVVSPLHGYNTAVQAQQ